MTEINAGIITFVNVGDTNYLVQIADLCKFSHCFGTNYEIFVSFGFFDVLKNRQSFYDVFKRDFAFLLGFRTAVENNPVAAHKPQNSHAVQKVIKPVFFALFVVGICKVYEVRSVRRDFHAVFLRLGADEFCGVFAHKDAFAERVFVNIESSFFHPFRGFDRRFMSFVVKAFAVSAWSEFYHKFLFVIFATSRSFPI